MTEEIVYVDMDGVLADFDKAADNHELTEYDDYTHIPGWFEKLQPVKNAIKSYWWLSQRYDTYILSSPPDENPSAWAEKVRWVSMYLPGEEDNLILSRHKNLNKGDYLIDDRKKKGSTEFEGLHLHFGSKSFPDWKSVIEYFKVVKIFKKVENSLILK